MSSHAKDGWTDGDPPPGQSESVDDDVKQDAEAEVEVENVEVNDDNDVEDGNDDDSESRSRGDDGTDFGGAGRLPPPPVSPGAEILDYYETEIFGEGATGLTDLVGERDEYREALLRVKADFENYRKRVAKEHTATVERAAEKLVAELLPVLDACEAALAQGADDVAPIFKSFHDILEKSGLTRMESEGQIFDPNRHEAVLHEDGDGDETIVVEDLRAGYLWNGRVVRPAMVKVKG